MSFFDTAYTCIALYQVRGLQSALHYNLSFFHAFTHSHANGGRLTEEKLPNGQITETDREPNLKPDSEYIYYLFK